MPNSVLTAGEFPFTARYRNRVPDPGECRVTGIDWEKQVVHLWNGICWYTANFQEVEIIGDSTAGTPGAAVLLEALQASRYPNTTLYLIWHYFSRGDTRGAAAEYRRDYDKLGQHRATVKRVLAAVPEREKA